VLGQGAISGQEVVLVRPRTYMNHSGVAAGYLRDRYHVTPESILVVYDDMDLPIGKVRIRAQGSSAGHRGIESIIAELGTRNFPRIRIGVGHPEGADIIPHVLGPFNAKESAAVDEAIDQVTEAVGHLAEHGLDAAMNRYN
jgi:PTH1 family peptidyl-tRNA hydrolase